MTVCDRCGATKAQRRSMGEKSYTFPVIAGDLCDTCTKVLEKRLRAFFRGDE